MAGLTHDITPRADHTTNRSSPLPQSQTVLCCALKRSHITVIGSSNDFDPVTEFGLNAREEVFGGGETTDEN